MTLDDFCTPAKFDPIAFPVSNDRDAFKAYVREELGQMGDHPHTYYETWLTWWRARELANFVEAELLRELVPMGT